MHCKNCAREVKRVAVLQKDDIGGHISFIARLFRVVA
jgi:hypothetical protein